MRDFDFRALGISSLHDAAASGRGGRTGSRLGKSTPGEFHAPRGRTYDGRSWHPAHERWRPTHDEGYGRTYDEGRSTSHGQPIPAAGHAYATAAGWISQRWQYGRAVPAKVCVTYNKISLRLKLFAMDVSFNPLQY